VPEAPAVTFGWPPLLLALLLVPLGVLLARRVDRGRRGRVSSLTGTPAPSAAARAVASGSGSPASSVVRRLLGALPGALVVLALLGLAFALARPAATVALPRLEGTVMLVIDVSGSMAADDVAPTRMDAAKAAAQSILDKRPDGVIVGVVAFSDAGMTVQAPTSKTGDLQATIARLQPTRGTSLGSGLLAALDGIEKARQVTPPDYYSNRSPEPTATPAPAAPGSDAATVIVVLSDGENNERPDPLEAAQAAADKGVRILSIGVGTPEGATLDLDGFRVDTRLDEGALQSLADATGGSYTRASDADPATTVYDDLARSLVVRDESVELTGLVAGASLVLLLAGVGLSLLRTGRLP
jgi:Ca-activated chloride channel homolog